MPKLHRRVLLLGMIALALGAMPASRLFAQSVEARIDGTITDPSGAIVPGAQITLKGLDTGAEMKTTSTGAGAYFLPNIPPGRYSLTVTAPGFQNYVVPEFRLSVNERRTLDARLVVGAATSEVEVTASAVALSTSDATIGTVIQNQAVNELPLGGRNFSQLVLLTPGASPAVIGQQSTFIITGGWSYPVNGMRADMNNFTLDGVENNMRFSNTYAASPPPDAIEELKVASHQTDAEVSFAAGSNVNVVTRAGTNSYHGAAWNYLRHEKLAAQNFFDNYYSRAKLPFRQNQFGFAAGGPVLIPRVMDGRKSNTYVFGYYEGSRYNRTGTAQANVPTEAQRNGDLSGLLGAVIGKDCLGRDVRSKQIYDPLTTVANANCPQGYIRDPFPNNVIPSSRIAPAAKAYLQSFYPLPNQAGTPNFSLAQPTNQDGDQWGIRGDHYFSDKQRIYGRVSRYATIRFSPGSLPEIPVRRENTGLNVVGHYNRVLSPTFLLDFTFGYNRAGVPYGTKLPGEGALSALGSKLVLPTPSGGMPVGQTLSGSQITTAGWQAYQLANPDYTYQYDTDFKKIIGRHSMAFGFRFMRYVHIAGAQGTASMTHSPQTTGLPGNAQTGEAFAGFLVDVASSSLYNMLEPYHHYGNIYNAYWGDTWKVTPRLTVNFGLQYVFASPPVLTNDHISLFDIPTALTQPNATNWTFAFLWCSTNPVTGAPPNCPRRSIVEPDRNNFAPRLGVAFALDNKTVIRLGSGVYYDYNTNIIQNSVRISQGVWPFTIAGSVTSQNLYGRGPLNPPLSYDNPFPLPPLGPPAPLFTINRFNRDPYAMQWNFGIERMLPGATKLAVDYVGSGGRKLLLVHEWNTAPAGLGSIQDRRPLRNTGTLAPRTNMANSNYNSLQVKVERSVANGLTFRNSYTWSKSLDIQSGANSAMGAPGYFYDFRLSYGPSDFDITHVNSTSFVYHLPFGRGQKYAARMSRAVDLFVGGWQASGIVSLRSGLPFTVLTGQDIANTGAVYVNVQTPNVISPPVPSGFDQTRLAWFDTKAFQLPTFGTLGKHSRNSMRGPSYQGVDFALMKNFRIMESLKLQFRSEFFNFFNHTNFGNPVASTFSTQFGQIWGAYGAREVQMALKLLW